MVVNNLLIVGVGGRGTLVCSILKREIRDAPVCCIDSDLDLNKADLPMHTNRLLLRAGRSPNRSIEYAEKMLEDERPNLVAALNSHLDQIAQTSPGRPLVAILASSPRGGISNAFTFAVAQHLHDRLKENISTMLVVVVPTYNRDYVDVITRNSGVYFRGLEDACDRGIIHGSILLSEDFILDSGDLKREGQQREMVAMAVGEVLHWFESTPTEEWKRFITRHVTLGISDVRADQPAVSIKQPSLTLFANSLPFSDAKMVFAPAAAGGVETEFGSRLAVRSSTALTNKAVVLLALRNHPDFELFGKAKTLSKMTCWKFGGVPCPLQIDYSSRKVFVGMSFRPELADIYEHGIKKAAEDAGLSAYRADDELSNIDIMCKVCKNMQEAAFAVIDISGMRPNVMFELGLLYGRGKNVILLQRVGDEVPTDLKGLELIPYQNSGDVYQGLVRFFRLVKR